MYGVLQVAYLAHGVRQKILLFEATLGTADEAFVQRQPFIKILVSVFHQHVSALPCALSVGTFEHRGEHHYCQHCHLRVVPQTHVRQRVILILVTLGTGLHHAGGYVMCCVHHVQHGYSQHGTSVHQMHLHGIQPLHQRLVGGVIAAQLAYRVPARVICVIRLLHKV